MTKKISELFFAIAETCTIFAKHKKGDHHGNET